MLGPLTSLDDIVRYLQEENFEAKYVCGDNTYCGRFAQRVDPELVRTQTPLQGVNVHRRWWIERNEVEDKFHLWCSYFDKDWNPITLSEFITKLRETQPYSYVEKVPATKYSEDAWITWVPISDTEYTATYVTSTPTSGCLIVGPFNKLIRL
jgi:hypothetical protein